MLLSYVRQLKMNLTDYYINTEDDHLYYGNCIVWGVAEYGLAHGEKALKRYKNGDFNNYKIFTFEK
jgi:hypothetical protein